MIHNVKTIKNKQFRAPQRGSESHAVCLDEHTEVSAREENPNAPAENVREVTEAGDFSTKPHLIWV